MTFIVNFYSVNGLWCAGLYDIPIIFFSSTYGFNHLDVFGVVATFRVLWAAPILVVPTCVSFPIEIPKASTLDLLMYVRLWNLLPFAYVITTWVMYIYNRSDRVLTSSPVLISYIYIYVFELDYLCLCDHCSDHVYVSYAWSDYCFTSFLVLISKACICMWFWGLLVHDYTIFVGVIDIHVW